MKVRWEAVVSSDANMQTLDHNAQYHPQAQMDMAEAQVFHISPCYENEQISLPPSCIAIMESGSAEAIEDAATIKLHTP